MSNRILIIENEPRWHEAYIDYLKGHQLAFAVDYITAIDMLNEKEYDYIILNINLKSDNDRSGVRLMYELERMEYPAFLLIVTGDKRVTHHMLKGSKNVANQYFKNYHIELDDISELLVFIEKMNFAHYIRSEPLPFRNSTVGIHRTDENNYQGTGCICSYNGNRCIITCAHVLRKIENECGVGSEFEIFPFQKQRNNTPLISQVLYYKTPTDSNIDSWTAFEDIAILSLPKNIELVFHSLRIKDETHFDNIKKCSSYGYGPNIHGHQVDHIKLETTSALGFQKVNFINSSLVQGDSGAPIFHIEKGILGIFAKTKGEKEGYVIPKIEIIKAFKLLKL